MLAAVINAMKDDFYNLCQLVLDSPIATNIKSGTTLKDSQLADSLRVISKDVGIFSIFVNQYIDFIESGRRKGAKMPPVEPIIEWCKRRNIPTDNNTVWLIRKAISRDGIKPRKIMDEIFAQIEQAMTDKWFDQLFLAITEELWK